MPPRQRANPLVLLVVLVLGIVVSSAGWLAYTGKWHLPIPASKAPAVGDLDGLKPAAKPVAVPTAGESGDLVGYVRQGLSTIDQVNLFSEPPRHTAGRGDVKWVNRTRVECQDDGTPIAVDGATGGLRWTHDKTFEVDPNFRCYAVSWDRDRKRGMTEAEIGLRALGPILIAYAKYEADGGEQESACVAGALVRALTQPYKLNGKMQAAKLTPDQGAVLLGYVRTRFTQQAQITSGAASANNCTKWWEAPHLGASRHHAVTKNLKLGFI